MDIINIMEEIMTEGDESSDTVDIPVEQQQFTFTYVHSEDTDE
jgi:hypothetical protein